MISQQSRVTHKVTKKKRKRDNTSTNSTGTFLELERSSSPELVGVVGGEGQRDLRGPSALKQFHRHGRARVEVDERRAHPHIPLQVDEPIYIHTSHVCHIYGTVQQKITQSIQYTKSINGASEQVVLQTHMHVLYSTRACHVVHQHT